jgi:hypothetical protein
MQVASVPVHIQAFERCRAVSILPHCRYRQFSSAVTGFAACGLQSPTYSAYSGDVMDTTSCGECFVVGAQKVRQEANKLSLRLMTQWQLGSC